MFKWLKEIFRTLDKDEEEFWDEGAYRPGSEGYDDDDDDGGFEDDDDDDGYGYSDEDEDEDECF